MKRVYDVNERWQQDALCLDGTHDPEIFFPENSSGVKAAKKICDTCPVRAECLSTSFDYRDFDWGVWGGFYGDERFRIHRMLSRRIGNPNVPVEYIKAWFESTVKQRDMKVLKRNIKEYRGPAA